MKWALHPYIQGCKVLLHLGGGVGDLCLDAIRWGFDPAGVVLIDLSASHIAMAREYARSQGVRFHAVRADAQWIPLTDESVDVVVAREIFLFSDEFAEMERQALEIAKWGDSVYVKIPITNTRGKPTYHVMRRLANPGVRLNATAILTLDQVRDIAPCPGEGPQSYISVFAGRIADTGRDPMPIMAAAAELLGPYPNLELIWASPRELLNMFHADAVGCHIITVTHDVLKKLNLVGKDLHEYSSETVKMFYDDGQKARYTLS